MFQPVTDENVFKILQSLNSNKATGLDKVSPRFLKDGAKFITAPLTYIINLPISQGKIPSELKSAKITPIYKKQNKAEPVTTGLFQYLVLLVNSFKRLFMTNLTSISQITNYYTSISQASGPPTPLTRV